MNPYKAPHETTQERKAPVKNQAGRLVVIVFAGMLAMLGVSFLVLFLLNRLLGN